MISSISIKNFKCLRDVSVELAPFTVLIGPNDSGKSSFLDAIHFLGRTTREPIQAVFSGDAELGKLVWMKDPQAAIS